MARAATSPELALYRTPGKWSKLHAAIYAPATIYTARVNQTFTGNDQVLEITYDGGSGTLADVLADMTMLVGSSAGAHDKGIVRIRSVDGSKFYISETSDIEWANDLYLTVIDDYGLWAKHVLIDEGVSYMDGGIEYSDQHTNFDPVPIMGSHRVLKLTGATVTATYDFSDSYVIGSTISAYATTSPTASGGADLTTDHPTLEWDTTGWHTVYLTLTAANSKTFFGVRYVYVWNDANPPSGVILESAGCDAEAGGWDFNLTMLDNVTLSDVRDRALVIVFSEDYYGDTASSIGPVTGSENILCLGWISEESINWNPEQGQVRFKASGAHYWFSQIPAFPDGVELVTGTPDAWTEIQGLTIDRGLFHFLHWRTTATRIMDVFLTSDTKYSKEVSSLAGNLWEQLREMAFLSIFARPGVNAHGQLYIEVHPQLVPEASRSWPTVMTITTADWIGQIDFERVVKPEVSAVSLSGVAVSVAGVGTPYFSISPGHAYPRYGALDVQDNLLLASQVQANVLAGLYRSWRNNEYPEIPIALDADIRLIDCFPRQQCAISITAGDTPRGITYSGNIVPTSIQISFDAETGHLRRDVTFEAETLEGLAATSTVPGEGDRSVPPVPSLPPLPPLPPITPGGFPAGSEGGPVKVLLHDAAVGLIYTENFSDASPTWTLVNGGLTGYKITQATHMFVCPNGAVYVANLNKIADADRGTDDPDSPWIAYAPSIGATFTIIKDEDTLWADYPATTTTHGIVGIGYNPLVAESVTCIMGEALGSDVSNAHIWLGAGGTFAQGVAIPRIEFSNSSSWITYGQNTWVWIGNRDEIGSNGAWWRINAACSSLLGASTGLWDISENEHFRASTTGILFVQSGVTRIRKSTDNGVTWTSVTTGKVNQGDVDPTGQYLMSAYNNKSRSADGGASWYDIPNLPVGGAYYFKFAGGEGTATRWIAARAIVRYSPDFGETWENKEGNITSIAAVPSINMIHVVEY